MIYYPPDSGMSVGVIKGDITTTHLDAVVNAGNTSLWLGTGVAGAIHSKGGTSIQDELNLIKYPGKSLDPSRYTDLNKRACNPGDVVVTHAGRMTARYVLHAAVMDCRGPLKAKTSEDIIRMCTVNCMLKMRELRLNGMAVPLFGTGVGSVPYYDSARIMVQAIRDYYHDGIINFYAFDDKAFEATSKALAEGVGN